MVRKVTHKLTIKETKWTTKIEPNLKGLNKNEVASR